MSTLTRSKPIRYPDSDGKPMADNTLQFRWIVKLEGGLDVLFTEDPNVFVAGDLLWYPVMGSPEIRQAPDAMVVFGRPKGDRGSYKQWEEDNIAPQVVFEVLSPRNYRPEMRRKLQFYETYGVEEYYVYDPDKVILTGCAARATVSCRSRSCRDGRARCSGFASRSLTALWRSSAPMASVS